VSPSAPNEDDYVAVDSALVGEVVLFVRSHETPVPAKYASAVRYTLAELEKLQGMGGEEELRVLHATKKYLGGVLIRAPEAPPFEPPPNQAVHDMFDRPHRFCCPTQPAPGHRLWRSIYGVVVCGTCHPPAVPRLVAKWIE